MIGDCGVGCPFHYRNPAKPGQSRPKLHRPGGTYVGAVGRSRNHSLQFPIRPAVYLIFALILAACGIPSTSYLPPVPVDTVVYPFSASETNYSFQSPDPATVNPDIFEGFEIYYRFIPTQDEADLLDAGGDLQFTDTVSQIQLFNTGYSRLAASGETPTALPDFPLVTLTDAEKADSDFTVNIEFSNIGTAFPQVVLPGSTVKVLRTLTDPNGIRTLKGFTPADFLLDDADLPEGFDPASAFEITIVLYVLCYGNNFNEFDFDIYSLAVYLGATRLRLSQ